MEVTGRIKIIGQPQDISSSFRKRELVVTTEEQYPQHITIEFVQDKADLLNNFQIGEQVRVSINLRGREWTNPQGETRYFNSIHGWRIDKMQQEQVDSSFQGGYNPNQQQNQFGQNQEQNQFGQNQQQNQFGQNQQQQNQFGQNQQQQNQFGQNQQAPSQFPPATNYNEEDHDDLPF